MWVMHTRGFFSVVAHREDPSLVLVRARDRGDLENLVPLLYRVQGFSQHIEEPRVSDYAARMIIPKDVWLDVLRMLGEEADWSNFKNAVRQVQGPKRESVYHRVWGVLLALQDREPWANAYLDDDAKYDAWWNEEEMVAVSRSRRRWFWGGGR